MTDCRLDVLCIGNAIVDIIADADDAFLAAEGLTKGSMRLIDAEEAERLYSHMGPAREISGGSAANTAAGVAALGARAGFIGQVAPDQLGTFYRHDLTAAGVEFTTEAKDFGIPTARSMILVTPDGHRTMNTFLGAAQHLPSSALDEEQIRSAANTAAGVAALGARAGFIGQVAPDQLGTFYRHDLTAAGVEFTTEAKDFGIPTARSMILVTPDGHRTMNTFLGAAQHLPSSALDEEQIRSAAILYLEGYLWDPETPRYAMVRAIEVAREAGRKVAFTLSDSFCVDRHRDGFNTLIDEGRIDILFANEDEIQAMAGVPHVETAVDAFKDKVETLVVTRSEKGALATQRGSRADVPAASVEKVVDTTGAGDLFAAGFLAGQAQGRSLEESLKLGAIAAAEVISHYGARPEADLKALAGELVA